MERTQHHTRVHRGPDRNTQSSELKGRSHRSVCPFWSTVETQRCVSFSGGLDGRGGSTSAIFNLDENMQLQCYSSGVVGVFDIKFCWCRWAGHLYRSPPSHLVFLYFVPPLVLWPDNDVASLKKWTFVKLVCDDGHVCSGLFQAAGRGFYLKDVRNKPTHTEQMFGRCTIT